LYVRDKSMRLNLVKHFAMGLNLVRLGLSELDVSVHLPLRATVGVVEHFYDADPQIFQ